MGLQRKKALYLTKLQNLLTRSSIAVPFFIRKIFVRSVQSEIRMKRIYLLLFLATACQLGPRYEVPEVPMPEDWKGCASTEEAPTVEHWWDLFEDETLAELEERVIAANPDLYAALQKVEAARAVAGIAKSELYPQVSLQPSYKSVDELIKLYGVPTNVLPGLKKIVRVHEQEYALPVNMNYEVDIWRRYRGIYDAATMYAQSMTEEMRATLLMLTSDLASDYFNARVLDTQISILEEVAKLNGELLQLRQMRYLAGLDSYFDVLSASQGWENAVAVMEESMRQRGLFEDAIAVLIGQAPSQFCLAKEELSLTVPEIPVGMPASLLVRRPDVARAERQMASAHALIGVAYSSFFPSLDLTGGLGFLSPTRSDFMTWKSRLWEWGANIFQTIFDGWRRSSTLDAIYAQFRETEGAYRKTVLAAFQDVEDALNNLEYQGQESEHYEKSWEAALVSANLYARKFETGVSNQLDVLNARIAEYNAQQSWVNMNGQRFQSTIQLIKAIGGSWSENPR